MAETFEADIADVAKVSGIQDLLREVCALTGMGFAAVARVTSSRWVACQVLDRIEFGMEPGDELDLQTTICDEIRASGRAVFIDHVGAHDHWRTHHTPAMYGFESYISVPIVLSGGELFGTLCAIDPAPRTVSLETVLADLEGMARRIASELDRIRARDLS